MEHAGIRQASAEGGPAAERLAPRAVCVVIAPCPFGPELQRYWDRRHQYFSRFDDGVLVDREGLFSVMPEDAAAALAQWISAERVLDGFAGVGGCAIAFARAGKHVIAVDIDPQRLAMARHNAEIYGVDERITFVCDDFFVVAERVDAGAVHLDPPWGGPSYRDLDTFRLRDLEPDGRALLEVALPRFREVALRVPLNFDVDELTGFDTPFTVHDDISLGHPISRTIAFHRLPAR